MTWCSNYNIPISYIESIKRQFLKILIFPLDEVHLDEDLNHKNLFNRFAYEEEDCGTPRIAFGKNVFLIE